MEAAGREEVEEGGTAQPKRAGAPSSEARLRVVGVWCGAPKAICILEVIMRLV